MKNIFLVIFSLTLTNFVLGQTAADTTRVICREVSVPVGFVVIGETTSTDCPRGAFIVKKRVAKTFSNRDAMISNPQLPVDKNISVSQTNPTIVEPIPGWVKVVPVGEIFTVQMPAAASLNWGGDGKTVSDSLLRMYHLEDKYGEFLITSFTWDQTNQMLSLSENDFLEPRTFSAINGIGGMKVERKNLTVGGYNARQYKLTNSKQFVTLSLRIYTPERGYDITWMAKKDAVDENIGSQFLRSFVFGEKNTKSSNVIDRGSLDKSRKKSY